MKTVMITSTTILVLVASAGMSTAGPLGDHNLRDRAQDTRSEVSQARDHVVDRAANNARASDTVAAIEQDAEQRAQYICRSVP
ncbi:hypothetical protein [Roseovarius sp. EL26]|uniref:hypothetical protein n=1 Tax=Roseovarius sp. EL26 TaxID=2126672 RepID=UPI000EA3F83C|nr:hypothetical protein [Roseovarius sp. EL26]